MKAEYEKKLTDLRAKQEKGIHTACPRCGYDRMKKDIRTNALSRHADGIYICDDCGTAEALLDFMNNPLPVEEWVIFHPERPTGDFKDTPGAEAWKEIQAEQVPYLMKLYRRWLDADPGSDFREYRREAQKNCKGLGEIWQEPFHAIYRVADGTLMLRFKKTDDSIEVASDLIEGGDKE